MSCDYCDERKGLKTIYNEIYGDINRIVYETKHFFVFPCMGQLREGHLLIASKEHINAMGMLKKEVLNELEDLILVIGELYKNEYGMNVLCFEHGVLSDDGCNGGCGIYHMHIHLIPIKENEFKAVLEKVKSQGTNKVNVVQNLADTGCCIEKGETYVFLERINKEQQKEMYIVTNKEKYFASQYMRQVICEVFGRKVWDWKKVKQKETEFLNTLEKAGNFFYKLHK